MKLFLVRHGESAESIAGGESQLTAKGKEESAKNALILKQMHPTIATIYHSTKLRAKETANIFHEILGHQIPLVVKENLKPNDEPELFLQEWNFREDHCMIVSHLPFLERLASRLLFGEERELFFEIEASSIVILEKREKRWSLLSLIATLEKSL